MSDCNCGTPAKIDPWQCEHYHVWRGPFRLSSVGRILREVWPVKPSWDQVDPSVIENARERGQEVDALFSDWINGTLTQIPAGTREDAVARFSALRKWWIDRDMPAAKAQVLLADDELCGVADVVTGGIYDVKNTAQIESTYSLQLGGYADLYEKQHGTLPSSVGVIHVTQPKDKPVSVRLLEFEVMTAVSEWRLLRQMWNLVTRKSPKRRDDANRCEQVARS